MRIIIAGATGFIGRFMVHRYLENGHNISVIGRSISKIQSIFNDRVHALEWDAVDNTIIKNADLIINLNGAGIADKRWTPQRKQEMLLSRINPTTTLANLCAEIGQASPPFFNASAIGIYGIQQPLPTGLPPALTEATVPNQETPDFACKIVKQWEAAAQPAQATGVRVVFLRFGVVLGKNGGALAKMVPPFQFFVGGKIGSGRQPFSWVCIVDLCRAIDFLIKHPDIKGPVNIVAPECVTQAQLATTLGKVLNKPSFMLTPDFLMTLAFGDMAKELLLNGQHVAPKVLLDNGFTFEYPNLESALRYALE